MFSSSQTCKTAIGSSVLDSSGRKALKTLHKCQWYKIFRSGAGVQVGSPYHWIPSLSWFSDPIEGTVTALWQNRAMAEKWKIWLETYMRFNSKISLAAVLGNEINHFTIGLTFWMNGSTTPIGGGVCRGLAARISPSPNPFWWVSKAWAHPGTLYLNPLL